jgi:three-Cys-motif partner protein
MKNALNVEFSTVKTLAESGRVDLLILFADRMDLVRNVERYEQEANSVLDRMLGPQSAWRDRWRNVANRSAENICRFFADEYQRQLKGLLGYRVFGEHIMAREGRPLYRLLFASKDKKGIEFWNKVTQKDRGGQSNLPF